MAVAYRAVSDGDLPHAAYHVACALYHGDVNDRQALALLDRLVNESQKSGADPLALAPLKRDNYAGTVAVRARILAHLGQYREAFGLLAQVQHADASRPLWTWAVEWAQRPGAAAQADPDEAGSLLASVWVRHGGVRVEDPAARAELESALPAVAALSAAHPGHEKLRWMHSAVLRKIGRVEEAARLSEAAWAAAPSYATAIALAMARQALGDVDGALACYRDALKFDPDDSAARADAALALYQAGRFADALAWAEEAREHDPKQETAATPLSFLLRYRLGEGPRWLDALHKFQTDHPRHGWTRQIFANLRWYVDYLPEPAEATINGVRKIVAEHPDIKPGAAKVRFGVSSIEVPSCRVATEDALKMPRGTLVMEVGGVPSPDPRQPIGPVDHVIWNYEGTDPRPAMPAPPAEVVAAVARLAGRPYDLDAWAEQAAIIAAQLGPGAVEGLLGVLVHPPATPDGWRPWNWIRSVQFAAALVLSRVDDGWEGSLRRKALVSLARGPVDWTTEAAIVALSQVCREETLSPAAKEEIVEVLRELARALPDEGHCCYHYALAAAVSRLPFPAEQLRPKFSPLWRYLETMDEDAARDRAEEAAAR
jgi:tetratricopeptide (TPR) repeat protein